MNLRSRVEKSLNSRFLKVFSCGQRGGHVDSSPGPPAFQTIDQRHEGMVAHVERILQDQGVNHTGLEILDETGRGVKSDNLATCPQRRAI